MAQSFDVVVVGGGVVAQAVAISLSDNGLSVAIVAGRKGIEGSASLAAGAMLGAFAEFTAEKWDIADRMEAELRVESGRIWPDWFHALRTKSAAPDALRRGTYLIANNNGDHDLDNIGFIKEQADRLGEANEWIAASDIRGLKPHKMSRPVKCLALPNEGYIESRVLLGALDGAIGNAGNIHRIADDAASISASPHGVEIVCRNGDVVAGSTVVVAAGVDSCRLIQDAAVLPPTSSVMLGGRGSSLVLESENAFDGVIRTPNRDFACGSHLVPLVGGRQYVGATNRLVVMPQELAKPTVGEILSLSYSVLDEINVHLRLAPIKELRSGFRPVMSDGYPLFGRTSNPRIFVATGTYRNGILMAPAIAAAVTKEILSADAIASPFSPSKRAALLADKQPKAAAIHAVSHLVSFVQDPGGRLPFERAAELERFIAALMEGILGEERSMGDIRGRMAEILERYPITEAVPLIFYDLADKAERRDPV